MNFVKLFDMQKELDSRIESEHGLHNESLVERKLLALLVELGELANETRCFKFWSKRPSSPKKVILEEYVDGIHFILSLGIEKEFEKEVYNVEELVNSVELVTVFMEVYAKIMSFKNDQSLEGYLQLLKGYLTLGHALEFSFDEIESAYVDKNTINHERQNNGY